MVPCVLNTLIAYPPLRAAQCTEHNQSRAHTCSLLHDAKATTQRLCNVSLLVQPRLYATVVVSFEWQLRATRSSIPRAAETPKCPDIADQLAQAEC